MYGYISAVTPEPRYPLTTRTLDNGLRVIASSSPGLGVVAVNLWYDVGSRHEEPDRQGFAHLFEHLMFQGSRHVRPGEHFALLQGHGGTLNATTSFDRTNYFESVPAGALDLALWLEADRMAFLDDVLTQENFKNQVAVVAQERGQRMDNVPYGTVFEKLLPLLFDPDHPYGHLPIGNMQQLATATLADVSAFHSSYYMPNNAVLSIVGDVAAEEAFAKANRYFGEIPPGDAPKRELPPALPVLAELRLREHVEEVPAPAVWFAGRLPADAPGSRDLAAAALAASVLGEGETSRLHRRLVRRDSSATSTAVGINPLIAGNSLVVASVRANADGDLDGIVAAVAEELDRLAADGPREQELGIVRAQAEREWLDDMATAAGRADAFCGAALLFDDPGVVNDRLPLIRSITAEEVRSAAKNWLCPLLNAQVRVLPAPKDVVPLAEAAA
jgi:zinc protease